MTLLICHCELTSLTLMNLSFMHQVLVGVPAPRRDKWQTKSQSPRAGAVDPSSVSQPWEACLLRKFSSRMINLRNLQSAMLLTQRERPQTAPRTAQQRKPRQLIEHLGTLAK